MSRQSQRAALSAGSGTSTSPSQALRALQNRRVPKSTSYGDAALRPRKMRRNQTYISGSSFSQNWAHSVPGYPHMMIMVPQVPRNTLRKTRRRLKKATLSQLFSAPASSSGVSAIVPLKNALESGEATSSKVDQLCFFYTRYGTCLRGETCFFSHEPQAVAICDAFVKKRCQNIHCVLRHESDVNKLPICQHFLLGNCLDLECPYPHHAMDPSSAICREFQLGRCSLDSQCGKLHSFVCADYHETSGFCPNHGRCPFQHPQNLVLMLPTNVQNRRNPQVQNKTTCLYWALGRCKRGNLCFYSHSAPELPMVASRDINNGHQDVHSYSTAQYEENVDLDSQLDRRRFRNSQQ